MLGAFRRQFEERGLSVPERWIEWLGKLRDRTQPGRRYATIIFVDLCDYTPLTNKLSRSRLKRIRTAITDIYRREIERYGGCIINFAGDGAFGVFGVPMNLDKDSEAALKSMLSIRESVGLLSEELGLRLRIHAGVATGSIDVELLEERGQERPDLVGPSVNLAARLQGYADEGEILVTPNLAMQLVHRFEFEPKGPFVPKGYEDHGEITPYALIGLLPKPAFSRGESHRFVGRGEELAEITSMIRKCEEGASIGLCVEGPGGIGKSRLVEEALRQAAVTDWKVYWLLNEPHFCCAVLKPIAELLRQVAGEELQIPVSTISAKRLGKQLVQHFDLRAEGAELFLRFILGDLAATRHLSALGARIRRRGVLAVMIDVLGQLAQEKPVLLVLDDAQWCDSLSWEVIEGIQEAHPPHLLLISIGRPGFEEQSLHLPMNGPQGWAAPRSESWRTIRIAPLNEEEQRELLSVVCGREDLHPLARRRILEEAGGVPLFVIEMARALKGGTNEAEISILLSDGLSYDRMVMIQELLQGRIDRLDRLQREIIQQGAVIGERFPHSLLEMIATSRENLREQLQVIQSLSLLDPKLLEDDVEYLFSPRLLREAAYGMMNDEQRRELHQRIAEALELKFAEQREEITAELAYHWTRAGYLQEARRLSFQVARRAVRAGAPHQAYAVLRDALVASYKEDAGDDPDLWREQMVLLENWSARAARQMHSYDLSLQHIDQWATLADGNDRDDWVAGRLHEQSKTLFEMGRVGDARTALEEAKSIPGQTPTQRAHSLLFDGNLRVREGDLEGALEQYEQILKLGADVTDGVRGDALSNSGYCLNAKADPQKAITHFDQAARAYKHANRPIGVCNCLSNKAMALSGLGRFAEAERLFDEAWMLAEEHGHLMVLSAIAANRADVRLLHRDWAAATEQASVARHYAEMAGHGHSRAVALTNLALSHCGLGDRKKAIKFIEECLTLARELKDPSRESATQVNAAWIAYRFGDANECRARLDKASANLETEKQVLRESLELALSAEEGGELPQGLSLRQLEEDSTDLPISPLARKCDVVLTLGERLPGMVNCEAVERLRKRRLQDSSRAGA